MENNTVEVENKETIIEEVTEKKEKQEPSEYVKLTAYGILGAVKELADKRTYAIGICAGLLFGRKTGLKTIGALVGVGAVRTASRYLLGEFDKK